MQQPSPGLKDLFLGFAKLGLIGFGGVLPFARREVVEQRRWLTAAEFADLLGLCQFLPGGNIINVALAIGLRFRGLPGAIAAFFGLMVPPTLIVLAMGAFYRRWHDDPVLHHLFAGLAAAAAGLLVAMALKMAEPLARRWRAVLVMLLVFCCVGLLRWPLLPVLVAMMAVSLAVHGSLPGSGAAK